MEPAPLLPVFMKMDGRKCLVVGAGLVALAKIEGLLACGAEVRVVSPQAVAEIQRLAEQREITWVVKEYSSSDLDAVGVIIAATDKPEVNHLVYEEGVARGLFVNVVDDPEFCDFYFGSIVRRGSLQIAISTRGESPAFAQQLKGEIDEALPPDTGDWLERLGELRRHVNRITAPGPDRISLLRELAKREACDPATCPCRTLQPRETSAA